MCYCFHNNCMSWMDCVDSVIIIAHRFGSSLAEVNNSLSKDYKLNQNIHFRSTSYNVVAALGYLVILSSIVVHG